MLVGGCGEEEMVAPPDTPPVLFPVKVYTGFDETAGYTVPIAASEATGITWESSDPAIATVTGNDTLATVTGVAAGTVTITATAGDAYETAEVIVTAYTSATKEAGQALFTDNGCGVAGCHDSAGEDDVTPSGLGKHTDDEIMTAITAGTNPEGGEIPNHIFADVGTDILAYMRSLPPKGPPIQDE